MPEMETVQHIPVPLSRVRDSVLAVITELGLDQALDT